jgi:membrane protein
MELPTSEKIAPGPAAALDRAGRSFWGLTTAAFARYSRRSGGLLAGSVAFFSLLSIVPVLFIAISVAGWGARGEPARETLILELSRWIGQAGADTVADILGRQGGGESIATRAFHAAVVIYMSTRLFSQLRRSINHLWDIEPLPAGGVKSTLLKQARRFLVSVLMVTLVEVLLLALVAVKVGMAVASARITPRIEVPHLARGVELLVSFGVVTLLFAAILRLLPDARIRWRDLWGGAVLTALLFSAGTTLVSVYLGQKAMDRTFGDGGAIVMLLLWVNYSAQIFFFGVAFTGEWAERRGGGIRPVHGARSVRPHG